MPTCHGDCWCPIDCISEKVLNDLCSDFFLVRTAFDERVNPHLLGFFLPGHSFLHQLEHYEVIKIRRRQQCRSIGLIWLCHSSPGLYKRASILRWGLLSAQHRFTHGLNIACSLHIRSGIAFIWQASCLGDTKFLEHLMYLQ